MMNYNSTNNKDILAKLNIFAKCTRTKETIRATFAGIHTSTRKNPEGNPNKKGTPLKDVPLYGIMIRINLHHCCDPTNR